VLEHMSRQVNRVGSGGGGRVRRALSGTGRWLSDTLNQGEGMQGCLPLTGWKFREKGVRNASLASLVVGGENVRPNVY